MMENQTMGSRDDSKPTRTKEELAQIRKDMMKKKPTSSTMQAESSTSAKVDNHPKS